MGKLRGRKVKLGPKCGKGGEEGSFDQSNAESYFSQLNLPTLSQTQYDSLENPITPSEIELAIKSLKPNKCPGPDGFSALYYKKFSHVLTPMLTEAFNSLLNNQYFRSETLTAIITMIPKPQSDDSACANYRPISLLNLDIKLLAKVMAFRLNNIIGSLINKDQVGFIPLRQASDNVRRAA